MYYSHFGLNQAPFKITPNTEFFFGGGNRGPILEALIYAIAHGEGIIKVTGEVGSGKTMLCHMLQARLPAHIETVYLANPSVSPEEILHAIAFELQLGVERNAARLEVMQTLHDFLLKRYGEGKRVVVFVEESQSMPLATLEEIRLLSNLETKNDKLLQIVLFGQPELDDNLRQPNVRQLRERITHSFRLAPLTAHDIRDYLMFRMRTAGYRGPDLFPASVIKYIASASAGLTRRVNLIADKALLAAFSEDTHTIKPKHVEAAVRDSEFSQEVRHGIEPRYLWGAALLAAGALIGVALYALTQHNWLSQSEATTAPAAATSNVTSTGESAAAQTAASPAPAKPPVEPATEVAATATATTPSDPSAAPAAASAAAAEKPAATETAVIERRGKVDLLEARIVATREWLASEPQTTYSIQLLGTDNPQQLKQHLNIIAKSLEMNKLFVYPTIAKQKPSLTVLYGSFDDRRAAQEALNKLPASLKSNRPILRTVQGVNAEIRQHQTS
ncbi:MAG: AAA family ATPase [Betaproteobacteria bacterium]|nr:AAA family ATPase [Betaproteobacteria bacterium]